jgi:RHS repeat-associated protein
LFDYRKHGRLLDAGTPKQARSSAVRGWLADTLAGRLSVLVVTSNDDAAQVSAEVRAQVVQLGRVEESGVQLGRDGNTAGVGDLVQTRRNGWELAGWEGNTRAPINCETCRVVATREDGGLLVAPLGGGQPLTLPASYVAADLCLGDASTAHSAQGRTVDTAHVVVDPGTSLEALYVGMSRGQAANYAHVVTHPVDEDQPVGAAHAVPHADPLSVLTAVVNSDAEDLNSAAVTQAEESERQRGCMQTAVERFAAEAEMVYVARTADALDGAKTDGFYGYNAHTDVETVTDSAGDTRSTYGYTAYGSNDTTGFTGIDKPDPATPDKPADNVYRFNATRWDPVTGSYDMGFRDYNPGLNRFLTRDAYTGALADLNLGTDPYTGNRYAFAGGNPISMVELDGHLSGAQCGPDGIRCGMTDFADSSSYTPGPFRRITWRAFARP